MKNSLLLIFALFVSATDVSAQSRADILILNGTIITMNAQRQIIEGGGIAIAGSNIVAVGESGQLKKDFKAKEVINAKGKVIISRIGQRAHPYPDDAFSWNGR